MGAPAQCINAQHASQWRRAALLCFKAEDPLVPWCRVSRITVWWLLSPRHWGHVCSTGVPPIREIRNFGTGLHCRTVMSAFVKHGQIDKLEHAARKRGREPASLESGLLLLPCFSCTVLTAHTAPKPRTPYDRSERRATESARTRLIFTPIVVHYDAEGHLIERTAISFRRQPARQHAPQQLLRKEDQEGQGPQGVRMGSEPQHPA